MEGVLLRSPLIAWVALAATDCKFFVDA